MSKPARKRYLKSEVDKWLIDTITKKIEEIELKLTKGDNTNPKEQVNYLKKIKSSLER